jgi:hypothetical protein
VKRPLLFKFSINFVAVLSLLIMPIAASAATFELSPSAASYPYGCERTLQVYADASGQSSSTADLILQYNPNQIEILDSIADQSGVQIQPGSAYLAYVANEVNAGIGRVRVTAISINNFLTSRKLFATIRYRPINNITSTNITIQFNGVGATTDSNISDSNTNLDILSGVTNATLNFTSGDCTPDTTAPSVAFVSPTPGQTNFGALDPISFIVTDNRSGININSLQVILNGVTYTPGHPQLSYTGSGNSYTVTLNLANPLPANQASTLNVSVRDNAGNTGTGQNVFNAQPTTSTSTSASTSSASATSATSTSASGGLVCDCNQFNAPPSVTKFINNTIFKDTVVADIAKVIEQDVGVASSSALITGAAVSLSVLPYLSLLGTPGLLLNIVGFWLGKRQRRPWGVVLDAHQNTPIAFATCRIYLSGAKTFIAQTISDTQGRYGFALQPGNYRLEVLHDRYVKHVEEIQIEKNHPVHLSDIKLWNKDLAQPANANMLIKLGREAKELISQTWRGLQPLIFSVGLLLAVVGFATVSSVFNLVILVTYLLVTLAIVLRIVKAKDNFASVVDAATGLRIPGAVVKIYNPTTWEVVDTQTTNSNGMFDYWGDAGEYAITVAASGYQFPSQAKPPVKLISHGQIQLAHARLSTGNNNLLFYVDPVQLSNELASSSVATQNLINPFS